MSGFVADFGVPNSGLSGQVALGSSLATAYVLKKEVTVFSSVPSGTGAVLPSSYAPGVLLTVCNRDATNALLLYPGLGDQIEATGVNVPASIPVGANVTLISFDPPLSRSPRTWWQVASYNQGAYLPLAGGTIAGPLTITGTLTANGTIVLSPASKNVTISPTGTGSVVINPATAGTLDNVALGQSMPLAATVTTLTATGVVTLNPASHDVTLSPTGTGKVVVSPAAAGTLDNIVIGGATPLAATVTTLTATSSVALSPANKNVVISPTGTGVVTLNPATAGTLDNIKIGSGTPLGVAATTLSASGLLSGAGFTARFATPGPIGNTVPSAGAFTTLAATGALTGAQRAFLSGLTTSRSSATVLAVSAGECADSTNAVDIQLGAFTKSTAGTWAAGSGGNGMGSGLTIANTTCYHVFAIINTGAADVYFDTSVTAANKPASTTAFRRIGSFLTDGSAQIVAFFQNGDRFDLGTPVQEYALAPGVTTAVTQTLSSVPTGVVVEAILSGTITDGTTSDASLYISSLAQTDVAAGATTAVTAITGSAAAVTSFGSYSGFRVITNTSAQIRRRVNTTTVVVNLLTNGWIDSRGRAA